MNTSGLKSGFVSSGPYRFTRNPQYVGDIILFVGVSITANSRCSFWITHALLILAFVIAPVAENPGWKTSTDRCTTSDFHHGLLARCTAPGEGMFTGVAVELDAVNRIFTTLPVVPVPREDVSGVERRWCPCLV